MKNKTEKHDFVDLPPMSSSSDGVWLFDDGSGEKLVHFWYIKDGFAGVCDYPTGNGWTGVSSKGFNYGKWRKADVEEEKNIIKPYDYESKCVCSDKQTAEFVELAKKDAADGDEDSVTAKLVRVAKMLNKRGVADLSFYIPVAYGLGTGVVYVPAKNLTDHEAVKKAEAKGKEMAEEFWLMEIDGKHYWRIWYD